MALPYRSRPSAGRCGSYHSRVDTPREQEPRRRLTVQSLGSGSSGNAYIVKTQTTVILVDCGVGIRQITAALALHGVDVVDVDAVVVSHEHSDHVRALDSVRRRRLSVMTTGGTAQALKLGAADHARLTPGHPNMIGDVILTAVATSHDAAEPFGVTIDTPGGVVSILTDMGCPNEAVIRACGASDLLVIEANHDVDMLRLGPYPVHLKRRVGSDLGHLSNRQTGEMLGDALTHPSRGPEAIWLAHLSATNNRPAVALETVRRTVGDKLRGRSVEVLPRLSVGPVWNPSGTRATQLDLFGGGEAGASR